MTVTMPRTRTRTRDNLPASTSTPCITDPDRWVEGGDEPELKALCRSCPRRWVCANEALNTPGAEGIWSGVHIPPAGRRRTFALRQLRSLTEHAGYPVNHRAG